MLSLRAAAAAIVLAAVLAPAAEAARVDVCGAIAANTTWTPGSVYVVNNCGVTVSPGATLTIQAGTVVKFAGQNSVLLVRGSLLAQGTAGSEVAFTSIQDDARGGDTGADGATSGAPGDWGGVRFDAGSTGQLHYVFAGFGGSGYFDYASRYNVAIVESFSSTVTLDRVTIRSSGNNGFYGSNASVQVTNCTIAANTHYGLYYDGVDAAVPLSVTDNTFTGNGIQAGWLHLRDTPAQISFQRNTATGPRNAVRADGALGTGSLLWDNGGGAVLLVSGGLTVRAGATLRAAAGSVIKFGVQPDVLLVQGSLEAAGTEASPVSFTSAADDARGGDTNGDGAGSGAPGQWGGIRFDSGSRGQLDYVFAGFGGSGYFDFAGRYNAGIVESASSDVTLDHTTLHRSGNNGLYAADASVAVSFSQITDNAQYGLYYNGVDPAVPLAVTDSSFSGNGVYAGWLHFRDAPGAVAFRDNEGTGPRNGFRADGRLSSGSLEWDNEDDLPLVVHGGLAISAAAGLTLQHGSVVKFAGVTDTLLVEGSLTANGLAAAPVAFTAIADDARGGDTNGDGASAASPGQWAGIRFAAGSRGRLSHAFVGFGGSAFFDAFGRYNLALIESFSSDVILDAVALYGSGKHGLYAENASVRVTGGRIEANAGHGLYYNGLDVATPLVIADNVFAGTQGTAGRLDLNGNPASIAFLRNTDAGGGYVSGFRLSGTLDRDASWDNTGSLPLLIDGGLTVAPAATLTVKPGTVVKFAWRTSVLRVEGGLVADGTAEAPIAFTSLADDARGGDTNGDGAASAAAPGDWGGLRFAAGSFGHLQHVFVGYGGSGYFDAVGAYNRALVESYTSALELRECVLRSSGLSGLYAGSASVAVVSSQLRDNAHYGLYYDGVDPESPLAVLDNAFSGNGAYGAWLHAAGSDGQIRLEGNAAGGGKNGFRVDGRLAGGSMLWDNPGQAVVVDGGLTIGAMATLTVAPASVVKFAGVPDVIAVEGTLAAEGTFAAPIAFTSFADDARGGDTNGDGPSAGLPGQWAGLRVAAGAAARFAHAVIAYGGSGYFDHTGRYNRALVEAYASDVEMRFTDLRFSGLAGVYAENAAVRLRYGVVSGNQQGVANVATGGAVDARRTWWGDASGPKHVRTNPAGTGDPVSDGVLFKPWLEEFELLEPDAVLLHDVERVSWRAFGTEASGAHVEIRLLGAGESWILGSGLAAAGELEWDTRAMADGPYELRAALFRADGSPAGEAAKTVTVNNAGGIAWHGGRLVADEVWGDDVVHVVQDDVIVAAGVRLVIEPGAIVKFGPGARIFVEADGVLDAEGTEEKPVALTALADDEGGDTNLDAAQSVPRPGDWNGVEVADGGQFLYGPFTEIRFAQAEHTGPISGSERWLGTLVHRIAGGVVVPDGATLTIDPGAVVKVDGHGGIEVQAGGTLIAAGELARPIAITSIRDDSAGGDTNQDGDLTAPAPGDWRWIYVNGGTATLDHVDLRYGAGTDSGQWEITGVIRTAPGAEVTLLNSVIRDGFYEGVTAWGGGDVTITNSVIARADRGVNADGAAVVRIVNSVIDGCRIGLWGHGGRLEIANAIVSNSSESGIDNVLSSPLTLRYSDVWSARGSNYTRTANQTGLNGNISADPRYVDRARGDFRLDYLSPAIDAADGAAAPSTDAAGAPRYDDPRTPNTGIAAPGGAFADMGAFEFVENAASPLDLVPSAVSGPGAAMAGETVRLHWTISNIGSETVAGPWHDAVNLVFGPEAALTVVPAGEVQVGQGARLGPGQSLAVAADVRVPGSIVGAHRWQVVTNSRAEVFEGRNRSNNTAVSASTVALDLPELAIDGPALSRQFGAAGEAHWFKFTPAAGQDVLVSVDRAGAGATELYLGQGYMPTRQRFDARQVEASAPDVSVLAAATAAQTYYVLAYPASLPGGPAAFTVGARTLEFAIESVGPATVGNAGTVTFTLRGGQLRPDMVFEIVDAQGGVHQATAVFVVDSSLAYVTFDLRGLPAGAYGVRVSDGPQTVVAPSAIAVTAGGPGRVRASLVMPEALRPDWIGTVIVEYSNDGGADVVAPVLVLYVRNGRLRLTGQEEFGGSTVQILGINREGPAGILPPGARGTVTLDVAPISSGDLAGKLWMLSDPAAPMNWSEIRAQMRPHFVPPAAWDAVFANFAAEAGATAGQYRNMLAENATYLSRLGLYVYDVRRLVAFEMQQAGIGALSQRHAMGALGRGAVTTWEIGLREGADGGIAIGAGGAWRFFRRQADGSYRGVRGETGTLTRAGDGHRLDERGGGNWLFGGDGRLTAVEDENGNRVTLAYDQGRLTELRGANGDVLSLHYGPNNRVSEIVDAVGRTSSFTYDASSQYLVAGDSPDGHMAFDYGPVQNGVQAVTRVTFPDGAGVDLDYDAQGRLTYMGGADGSATSVLTYDAAGGMTAADAAGAVLSVLLDADGNPARIGDGSSWVSMEYDAARRPQGIAASDGSRTSLAYDARGDLVGVADATGARLGFVREPRFGQLASFSDALGRTIAFARDAAGNLVRTTYPGGDEERFEYDGGGNLAAWVNGRGQRATYTHDGAGAIVRHQLPGGAVRTFAYDAHRNLVSVTDGSATTALEYDAGDHLVRITYPSGRWLAFAYDAGGRRASRSDQDGFVVNYAYDAQGRLARLTDADDDLIAEYAYDAAGRVATKRLGNGGVTRFEYDAGDRVRVVTNLAPDESLLSRFEYTYDREGRRTALLTQDGRWTFTYDGAKRLARAVFVSENPAVPGRDLVYEYDLAGNRTRTADGGASTEWQTNAAGQYAAAGDVRFEYDRDGNLVRRREGGLQWEYGYDSESRLTSVSGPDGSTAFEYDAFGQRAARVHDGVRTEYDVDPVLGDVVAMHTASGSTRLVHGHGLVSRVDAGNAAAYYTFDALGSTSELTDADGTVLNRYAYLPFGEPIALAHAVDDPFLFVAERGVLREPNGLYHMRARHYHPAQGRFLQRDPINIDGGFNLYAYVDSDPVNSVDESGLALPNSVLVKYLTESIIEVMGNPEAVKAAARVGLQNLGNLGSYVGGLPEAQKLRIVKIFTKRVAAREAQLYAEERVAKAAARGFGRTFVRGTMQNAGRTAVQSTVTATTQTAATTATTTTTGGAAGTGLVAVLTTPVSSLGAGTIAAGVVVAGTVGVVIGTGLRYIPGVDEGAQSAWIKLDEWTGGWLFGSPPVDEGESDVVTSHDPNDLIGPAGYGAARWVSSDVILAYTIRFENDKSASAPAQVVRITQQLDPDLDFAAFELGSFGFGDLVVAVPPGRSYYSERLDLRATHGLFLDVTAAIDLETGVVTWEFVSVDPDTGQAPRDPFAGFLPPNETSPMGQGFVTYTVRARSSVSGGQWIDAEARIVFDTNEPIDTPPFLNTLDAVAPASRVDPLPAVSYSRWPRIRWTGTDEGAGIATYDVYVSVDGGPFTLWVARTPAAGARFEGSFHHTYAFYSVARDHTGRVEAPPAVADATTRLEPLAGDANCDGVYTAADVPALLEVLAGGTAGMCDADANEDSVVGEADLPALLAKIFAGMGT